eukprot:scaffold6226_cov117-Isochrysis_galbana.AAC.7
MGTAPSRSPVMTMVRHEISCRRAVELKRIMAPTCPCNPTDVRRVSTNDAFSLEKKAGSVLCGEVSPWGASGIGSV